MYFTAFVLVRKFSRYYVAIQRVMTFPQVCTYTLHTNAYAESTENTQD